jgi:hypothetical protein
LESGSACPDPRQRPTPAHATITPIIADRAGLFTWMVIIVPELVTGGMVAGTAIVVGAVTVGTIGASA